MAPSVSEMKLNVQATTVRWCAVAIGVGLLVPAVLLVTVAASSGFWEGAATGRRLAAIAGGVAVPAACLVGMAVIGRSRSSRQRVALLLQRCRGRRWLWRAVVAAPILGAAATSAAGLLVARIAPVLWLVLTVDMFILAAAMTLWLTCFDATAQQARRALFATASVLFGLAFALALGEWAARLTAISNPPFYVADEITGWRLRPNTSGSQFTEGRAHVSINEYGMRDGSVEREPRPGVFRIAIIGDSYTHAEQVERLATFAVVLQDRLGNCDRLRGRRPEVLNFGVSGYGTAQELLLLRHVVMDFRPHLVLLAICTGNDIADNSKVLTGDLNRPYFELRDGKLLLDDSFRGRPEFRAGLRWYIPVQNWLLQKSRLLQVLALQSQRRPAAGAAEPSGFERGLLDEVYLEPAATDWREAWTLTEALIAEIAEECRRHGVLFAAATLSNAIQVHPDDAVRRSYQQRLHAADLFYPERRLQRLADRVGCPLLSLAPKLLEKARAERIYFHGFDNTVLGTGHWNEQGHERAGELMAKFLCEVIDRRIIEKPE